MEYLIFILLPPFMIFWLVISYIINDRKKSREYKEYIDSIKVGDIFVSNYVDISDDPFEKNSNYLEYGKIIVDIKKNYKGETWVKYRWLKSGNDGKQFTEEIHNFVRSRKRVKKSEN